jgi:hypothetical protein
MKTETEKTGLLPSLDQIRLLAEEHALSEEFFANAKTCLDAVTAVLKITETQAALFAMILERSGEDDATLGGIARALKCGKIQAMQYLDDLEVLEKKRLIISEDSMNVSRFRKLKGAGDGIFAVPMDVVNAVRAGKAYRYTVYRNLEPKDFYDAADTILTAFRKERLGPAQFHSEMSYLLGGNRNSMFVKTLKALNPDFPLRFPEQMILLSFCSAWVVDDDHFLSLSDIRPLMDKKTKLAMIDFTSGKHILFRAGLLEHLCDQGIADTEKYCLTDKAKETFLADVDMREQKNIRNNNMIAAGTIAVKELYYSNKICRQVGELTGLLREENFSGIVRRLKERNMKTGFACLFSGPPGTGKTETACQIARVTGRDIIPVEITDTKSMWFGESEKKIKEVFTRYRTAVKRSSIAPILLFNEADAVIGKRQNLGENRNGPGQTENAIQNIILQEIENLNGILIATTNLMQNMDKAFERRFLYKIEFEKPAIEARKAIWQTMIPDLSSQDIKTLAAQFDFSGGQIENIVRRRTVASILYGSSPPLEKLIEYCKEEISEDAKTSRIGFDITRQ